MSAPTVADTLRRARRGARWEVAGWVVLALVGLGAPYVLTLYQLQLAQQAAIMGILALSIGWLLRQTGQLSFGHAAFYGIAGYGTAYVAEHASLPIGLTLLAGIGCGVVAALVVGLVTIRVPGIAFAMLTLAIGMLVWVAGGQLHSITRGADGLNVSLEGSLLGKDVVMYGNPVDAWPLVWGLLMASVAALWALSRTTWGRRLASIRDNEERVRFSGYATYWPRVVAFTVSGLVASLAGTVNLVTTSFISLETLYWSTGGLALIVAVIGGVRSVLGPPVGAALFIVLQNYLSGSGAHYQAVLGVVLIIVVLVAPGGLAEIAARARTAAVVRVRHRATEPAPPAPARDPLDAGAAPSTDTAGARRAAAR
ncbi:branched-chain amino acid ABC transporter permease [Nocardioides mangrovi]|uniref:Branched-chain amino acid ABC transporter permease n=1 Tax=Nocardioides mangrovi TaxID=2874580 RepID=A0ABS7UCN8_9ACTN|nr:branched-chain amino acid ABC transporter permease [Nocardioides mangrovi]MBZ5738433.1 branched-chain amino acid ABC transporter permease [Nocardioides mangrovi]